MEAHGPDNPLLLPLLDNLTTLYVKQWAFSKAIQTSWRAYHIREKKFGVSNPETVAGLSKLAGFYLDDVRLLPTSPSDKLPPIDAAQTNLAADAGSELQGSEPSTKNTLAMDDVTKLAIAEALFRQVLEVQGKAYGKENTRLVDVLESLGEVLALRENPMRRKRHMPERSPSWRRVSVRMTSDLLCW